MKFLVGLGLTTGAMFLATGCADTPPAKSTSNVRSDVTDIRPIEPAAPAAYQPPMIDNSGVIPTAQQPVTADVAAAAPTTAAPMLSATPDVRLVGEKKHTVVRGETLFSIARSSYGDGKAWKKIVAANPGVSPGKLKVGQVLAMP